MKGAKKLGFSFNVRTPTSVIINAVNNRLKKHLSSNGTCHKECRFADLYSCITV